MQCCHCNGNTAWFEEKLKNNILLMQTILLFYLCIFLTVIYYFFKMDIVQKSIAYRNISPLYLTSKNMKKFVACQCQHLLPLNKVYNLLHKVSLFSHELLCKNFENFSKKLL